MKNAFFLFVVLLSFSATAQRNDTASKLVKIVGNDTILIDNLGAILRRNPDIKEGDIKGPKFNGNLNDYLKNNLQYPIDAKQKHISGTVALYVHFDATGAIIDAPIILKYIYPSIDAEAIRLIQSMPKWIPATNNGSPIDTWWRVEIPFK